MNRTLVEFNEYGCRIVPKVITKRLTNLYGVFVSDAPCKLKRRKLAKTMADCVLMIGTAVFRQRDLPVGCTMSEYLLANISIVQYVARYINIPSEVMQDAYSGDWYRWPAIRYVKVYYITKRQRRKIVNGQWGGEVSVDA